MTTKTKKTTKPVKMNSPKPPRANVETFDKVLAMVAEEGGLSENQVKNLLNDKNLLPKGSRFKKGYRFKDNNAPKRPVSSYMLWLRTIVTRSKRKTPT